MKKAKKANRRWNRNYFINAVHLYLLRRMQGGVLNDECDFLMGASVTFFAHFRNAEIPASWVICPMTNKKVADSLPGETIDEKIKLLLNDCPELKQIK